MIESPLSRLQALLTEWEGRADREAELCREANHAGNKELDAYRDGKAMAFRECLSDMRSLLAALAAERQPVVLDHCDMLRCPYEDRAKRAEAELAAIRETVSGWLKANAPGGWIDDLRKSTPVAAERREEGQ